MHNRDIRIIPPTMPKSESKYKKTPGKLRVLGYSRVIRGVGVGAQIRKRLKRIIAHHTDWELIKISTDYCEAEDQEETCKNFLRILTMVKFGYIDALIIYSGNDIESLHAAANTIYLYCKRFEVDLYISHNGQLNKL